MEPSREPRPEPTLPLLVKGRVDCSAKQSAAVTGAKEAAKRPAGLLFVEESRFGGYGRAPFALTGTAAVAATGEAGTGGRRGGRIAVVVGVVVVVVVVVVVPPPPPPPLFMLGLLLKCGSGGGATACSLATS